MPRDALLPTIPHRFNVTAVDASTGAPSTNSWPASSVEGSVRQAINKLYSPNHSSKNTMFAVNGTQDVELRLWGVGAANQTVTIDVIGFPKGWPASAPSITSPDAAPAQSARGMTLLSQVVCTLGTSSIANVHPVTGEAVAATTFQEVDTYAIGAPYTEYDIYDGTVDDTGNDNRQARLVFDPQGCESIGVFITAKGTVSRIEISLRPIG